MPPPPPFVQPPTMVMPPRQPMPALTNMGQSVPGFPSMPPGAGGLAPELAALVSAGEAQDAVDMKVSPAVEKKPRLLLLITKLAPELQETHMQQLLDQCGDVQAWRRARDANGAALAFGFAQFN